MILEASALKPLGWPAHAISTDFGCCLGDWIAKQRQVLSLAEAALIVEFETMLAPVAQKRLAQVMAGFREVAASRLRLGFGFVLPNTPELHKAFFAEQAKLNILGRCILGVKLKPVALKDLGVVTTLVVFQRLREPEYRKAAVALPIGHEQGVSIIGAPVDNWPCTQ